MLAFDDSITMTQLKDCATRVSQRKFKQAISRMFSTQMEFAVDCLRGHSKSTFVEEGREEIIEKRTKMNTGRGSPSMCVLRFF